MRNATWRCAWPEGQSNAAIAKARGTHVRTVANQLAALFRKLGVASRAELRALLARGGS
jgi:DNA-binding CsgD family transcriptional regulator